MEYRSAIVDECGYLVAWCSELSRERVSTILEEHPEYTISCIECECDGYTSERW